MIRVSFSGSFDCSFAPEEVTKLLNDNFIMIPFGSGKDEFFQVRAVNINVVEMPEYFGKGNCYSESDIPRQITLF